MPANILRWNPKFFSAVATTPTTVIPTHPTVSGETESPTDASTHSTVSHHSTSQEPIHTTTTTTKRTTTPQEEITPPKSNCLF